MLRRTRTVFAFGICLWLLWVAGATAHTEIVKTSPRNGAVLERLPRTVSVTYSSVLAGVEDVAVAGPDGAELADGPRLRPTDARTATAQVRPSPVSGRYSIEWVVISVDGHRLRASSSIVVRPTVGQIVSDIARLIRAYVAVISRVER